MNHIIRLFYITFFTSALTAAGNSETLPSSADLFHRFDQNLFHTFSNSYGLYHLTAVGLSYGLVKSGADWEYYSFMKKNKLIYQAGFAGVISGGLIPITVPFYLYFAGKSRKNAQLMYTGLALGQAVITGLLITSTYKAITGRKPPQDFDKAGNKNDYSDNFSFGFMRRGIFDGWPSGHTTNAFAMATVLWEMYPDNEQLKFYSGVYAFFIGLSVSTNIHWFSDFVAGALMGYSIGKSVGQSFRDLSKENSNHHKTTFLITPAGFQLTIRF